MIEMKLSQIQQYTNGVMRGDDRLVRSVAIDSRQVVEDALFVAIPGEKVDGHDYLDQAQSSGAAGALVERYCDSELSQIKVVNTVKAMAEIARECRHGYIGKVIGITGSCGKTTTKEMLVGILSQLGSVSSTRGNQNNEIGVPLTLFALESKSLYAVVEMGAAQQGDIAYLMNIVAPDISVITNVRTAHIGRFGSEEIIAETKAEIYTHLKSSGKAVINLDEKYSGLWREQLDVSEIITYSIECGSADVFADEIEIMPGRNSFVMNYKGESLPVRLQVPGRHNIYNALSAASCALALDISLADVVAGLELFQSVSSRMQIVEGSWGGVLIDDTYNANPASVNAATDVLAQYAGKRFLVLGDMAELGESSHDAHVQTGCYARDKAIEVLLTCGTESRAASMAFGNNAVHFNDKQTLSKYLLDELKAGDVVLVKGSRSAAMEDVVSRLTKKVVQ